MSVLRELLRRLDRWQRSFRVKVVLTALTAIVALGVAIPVHLAVTAYDASRRALTEALAEARLDRGDQVAIDLRDRGVVAIGDRVYGDASVRRHLSMIFNVSGEVANPGMVAELLLASERPSHVPAFLLDRAATAWLLITVAAAWMVTVIWLAAIVPLLLLTLGTAVVCLPFWLAGSTAMVVSVAGIGLLSFSFVILVRVALLALDSPRQIFAVAQTTVHEASRTGVSLGFIGILLVLLPLLPLWIDDGQPLRYQIQTFIARSLNLTFVIASAMTLLLACATVAFEIRDRQIWQLMTKPVSRLSYLLGKVLGVAVINLILLAICGLSIFIFIQEMRTRPASDPLDAQAVRDQVLVARAGTQAIYSPMTREQIIARVEAEMRDDLMLRSEIEAGERSEQAVRREIAQRIQTEHLQRQRAVPSGEMREFRFEGLGRARDIGAPITLRYTFYAGVSDSHETLPVLFDFGGDTPFYNREYVPAQAHVLTVPASVIGDDGAVTLQIWNLGVIPADVSPTGEAQFVPGPHTLWFDAEDLEILFRVGSFEWNFVRAMIVFWVQLCFLAVLGVCCATFLSFPVACILSFTIFMVASLAPFIAESLEYWYVDSYWRVDQLLAMYVSTAAERVLRAFGQVRPTDALVEGRVIRPVQILATVWNIGIVWCGVAILAGWAIFRRRELATYSGHG